MEFQEKFVGFVDATIIATAIVNFLEEGLESEKSVGQGYDGCAAMTSHENGVQVILRR